MIQNDFDNLSIYRADGRRHEDIREIEMKVGNNPAYDGSSHFKIGLTEVLCFASGPKERDGGGILATGGGKGQDDERIIEIIYDVAAFSSTERRKPVKFDKEFAKYTENLRVSFEALLLKDKYKRSRITLYVSIIQADGGVKSAVLNAITLALLDAGIEMRDINVAANVGVLPSIQTTPPVAVDLTANEENMSNARLTISSLVKTSKISFLEFEGSKINQADFERLLKRGLTGCQLIHVQMKEYLTKYYIRKMLTSR